MNISRVIFFLFSVCMLSCKGQYAFTNKNIGDAKTFQVNLFENKAKLIEPGINKDFATSLQDLIQNQTKLNLVSKKGDLIYNGEIIEYRISPTTATKQNEAAQNRLTITVKVHFSNSLTEKELEKKISFFYDYKKNQQLTGNIKENAINTIIDQINQDIFNASLANW